MPRHILHITDFHVEKPDGQEEFLRERYYREYIRSLVNEIRESEFWPVHCVVATGDLVHQGTVDNYSHVSKIFDVLLSELALDATKVLLCPGSHDVLKPADESGNETEARRAYSEFSRNYGPKGRTTLKQAVACSIGHGISAILLDSTLGSRGSGRPGPMSFEDIDSVVTKLVVETNAPVNDLLIVAAHYPLIEFPGNMLPLQEPDWHDRHYWIAALPLMDRISKFRANQQTLWLYGDIHAPEQLIPTKGNYHIVTGRFGTTIARASDFSRQAKVVRIYDSQDEPPDVLTLEHRPRTHKPQTQTCKWDSSTSPIRSIVATPVERKSIKATTGDGNRDAISTGSVILLDATLEKTLIEKIEEKELYSLGRFHTSDTSVSLSWVSLGPLFNSTGVLTAVIKKMDLWLTDLLKRHSFLADNDVVLLGMDCWGAVLASQLSVASGIKNYCIAARGRGAFHTSGELINEQVVRKLQTYKLAVFVCDVLATGASIQYVYDDIHRRWHELGIEHQLRWWSLSILADEVNISHAKCRFIDVYGTACKSLRMPLVPELALPSKRILPPTISFS